ncbi:MAG: bifunctional diaminohydroxyphosphoribosylaminopyrimidine deaminase/5-amino-6-(5-phosphoribosylamino)uracil reductase RibD [Acidobacteriota bacterium]
MRRALALARRGQGRTSPNPLVGAVVARDGEVLGQGFHRRAGEPHAEIVALGQAGYSARGASLYTNLEPCCHTGRTPPCVEEIIRAGVARVVAAMRDPDRRVNGGGFRKLREHGVRVDVGLLAGEAGRLNQAFVKFVRRGLPLVTLKGAVSLDGRIATRTGDSKWITSAEAREHAGLLRREHDALMVGIETVLADDPRLTARTASTGRAPLLRVIMDTHLRMSPRARLVSTLKEGPVVVFAGKGASSSRAEALRKRGVEIEYLPLRRGRADLRRALERLSRRGVTRLLTEGGGELHAAFIEQGLADRLVLYLAPRIIGGKKARPLVGGEGPGLMREVRRLRRPRVYPVGQELVVEAEMG